jgi:hypothetical protein
VRAEEKGEDGRAARMHNTAHGRECGGVRRGAEGCGVCVYGEAGRKEEGEEEPASER